MSSVPTSAAVPSSPEPTKITLASPNVDYEAVKTLVEVEDGALEPGGAPSVFSWQHVGLLAHIASVGVVYGTLSGVIYACRRLPRALRLFTAILSDCYPIFGYRRRPYLILGCLLTFVCCFLMAVLPLGDPYYRDPALADIDEDELTAEQLAMINHDAPDKGIKLIILFVFANLGTAISFGASDGYTASC
ncbi:uncharacterized protein PITG_07600 [Phytophthora infestans T30-4]|uniref:Transmembrane protein, putative n=1 Tax=Phytophthora infestans (strain T30-4) TaxID=403677 RepID=D0N8R2_PHYIT|nr:uncharacterized protein PITG_07600 [Phytophthora infestans T30-4]EEY53947.1 transmembrane protein, putative [Phytophthora infestans T30-4]|eukprot:XP_002904578.1 transmembrane protein, putative [Phytophthora infestans T30-4]